MNENNQNLRNDQTPAGNVGQENVYTVGEYGTQNAASAQQEPMQSAEARNEQPTPPSQPQSPQMGYTAPSGNNYT